MLSGSKICAASGRKSKFNEQEKHRELRTGVSRATMFLTEERRYKMRVKFKVLGEPKGKQRPRLCKIRGRSIVYTPKQTTEYEQK